MRAVGYHLEWLSRAKVTAVTNTTRLYASMVPGKALYNLAGPFKIINILRCSFYHLSRVLGRGRFKVWIQTTPVLDYQILNYHGVWE